MSPMIRRSKSASRLATALFILSSGMVAAGDNAAEFPTTSISSSDGTEDICQSRNDLSRPASSEDAAPTRSASIPQRRRHGQFEARSNPLIVGVPPILRRFPSEEPPFVESLQSPEYFEDARGEVFDDRPSRQRDENSEPAVAPLPAAPSPNGSDDQVTVHRTAPKGGLGMLAIDQIGMHLSKTGNEFTGDDRPVRRFSNDLVRPNGKDLGSATTVNDYPIAIGEKTLSAEDVPFLPPADETELLDSRQQVSISATQQTLSTEGLVEEMPRYGVVKADSNPEGVLYQTLATRPRRMAMDVDDLIAANSTPLARRNEVARQKPTWVESRPSLAQRLTGWSRKTLGGDQSRERHLEPSEVTPNRRDSKSETLHRSQRERVTTGWFNLIR